MHNNENYIVRDGTNDLAIIKEVFSDKEYNFSFLNYESIKTVVDVGSHIGSFCIRCEKCFPNAMIKTYELMKENYEFLQKNLELNKCGRVQSFLGAVYGIKKPTSFKNIMPYSNTGASELGFDGKEELAIPLINWSEVQTGDIDVLKLDCEGSEQSIIPAINCERLGVVYVEFHLQIYGAVYGEKTFFDLVEHFTSNGMKLVRIHCNACPNSSLPFMIFINKKYCAEKNLLKVEL